MALTFSAFAQDAKPDLDGETIDPEVWQARFRFTRERPTRHVLVEAPKRANEAIKRALLDPDALWSLLTDPASSFSDRAAAARQCGDIFPLSWVPRVMATLRALRSEEREHAWGLRANPQNPLSREHEAWVVAAHRRLHAYADLERNRTVLGYQWRAPVKITAWYPRPNDLDETEDAPWPLQVQLALEILISYSSPKMGVSCPPEAVARCENWLDAVLRIPCGTDDDAQLFVEAATAVSHHVTEPILARYRTLIIERRFKKSARKAFHHLNDIQRLSMCAAPETQAAIKVIFLDALRDPIDSETCDHAAFTAPGTRTMGPAEPHQPKPRRPVSPSLILELSLLALEPFPATSSRPVTADTVSRLSVYVGSACEAMDDPPFRVDRHMSPKDADRLMAQYRSWFEAHRPLLEAAAAVEAPQLDRARERLIALERK